LACIVGSGLKDFLKALSDVEKCLKPGGLVLVLDVDYDMLATTSFTYSRPPASELNPEGAWLVRILYGWYLVPPRIFLTPLSRDEAITGDGRKRPAHDGKNARRGTVESSNSRP